MTLLFAKPKRRKGRGCRVSDRDVAATEARHFANKRSYVRLDGSEVLYGTDWLERKAEIWRRGGGRCERLISLSPNVGIGFERCRNEMHDPHHIVKRSKRRDDRASNLIGLCRLHHDLLDERKPKWSRAVEQGI